MIRVYVEVKTCKDCPFCYHDRTEGAGYALDYFCHKKNGEEIAHYVECNNDFPKEPPEWCPFREETNNENLG